MHLSRAIAPATGAPVASQAARRLARPECALGQQDVVHHRSQAGGGRRVELPCTPPRAAGIAPAAGPAELGRCVTARPLHQRARATSSTPASAESWLCGCNGGCGRCAVLTGLPVADASS
jgi:hypothetical protein